jgi:hypothetical protein
VDGAARRLGVPEPVKAAPKTVAGHQVLPAPRNAKEAAEQNGWCVAEAARLAREAAAKRRSLASVAVAV